MKRNLLLALFLGILLSACNKNEPQPPTIADRTILAYFIATNNLDGYDQMDIEEMQKAIAALPTNNSRLLVYRVSYTYPAELFEIFKKDGKATIKSIKTYDNTPGSSVTQERFREVFSDMVSFAPANNYGLILWSHSLGWAKELPSSNSFTSISHDPEFTFGLDYNKSIDIDKLAECIPTGIFDFIFFDACYSGAIEVAYELKDKIDYIIASPTESISFGGVYDLSLKYLMQDKPNYEAFSKANYDYYNSLTGEYRSCAIALIDCKKLDTLAQTCKSILSNGLTFTQSGKQYYDFARYHFLYDFEQCYNSIATASQKQEFKKALNDVVIYKATTPYILGSLPINSNNYSGLSTYIMGTSCSQNESYYKKLKWYNDILR